MAEREQKKKEHELQRIQKEEERKKQLEREKKKEAERKEKEQASRRGRGCAHGRQGAHVCDRDAVAVVKFSLLIHLAVNQL